MENYIALSGFQIIEDPNLAPITRLIQFRFPKSKKKRIRNKWSKKSYNFKKIESEQFLKFGDKIIVSSNVYKKLKLINQKEIS